MGFRGQIIGSVVGEEGVYGGCLSIVGDLLDDLLGDLEGGPVPSRMASEGSVPVGVEVGIGRGRSVVVEVARVVIMEAYTATGEAGRLNGTASQMSLPVD